MTTAILILMVVVFHTVPALGQTRGNLEVPARDSLQSGIGFMSGWVCSGRNVEIVVNESQRLSVARNIPRADTESECGDTNNGFITQINWNLLGSSRHTVALVVDGETIQEHAFSVSTPDEEFLRGVDRTVELNDFPSPGESARLRWQEATQSFVLEFIREEYQYWESGNVPIVYPPGILPLTGGPPERNFLLANNFLTLVGGYDTTLDESGEWNILATGITWDTLTYLRFNITSTATINELLSLTRGPTQDAALRQSTILIWDRQAGEAPRYQPTWAYARVGRPTRAGNIVTIPIREVFDSAGVLPGRAIRPDAELTVQYNVWWLASSTRSGGFTMTSPYPCGPGGQVRC